MSHHIWRSGNHHSHVVSVSSRSSPKLSRSRPRRRGRSADRGIPRFLLQTHSEIRRKFLELEYLQNDRLTESLMNQEEDSKWRLDDSPEVTSRNRYSNIAAWEHNRIKLDVPPEHCNYINASPITLHSRKDGSVKRYICTQGPKEGQFNHIWRMIWQETEEVAVIVMLTKTFELGRDKCFQYFPETVEDGAWVINGDEEFRDGFQATIECVEKIKDKRSSCTVRKLVLKVGDKERTIWHLLFKGWPDFGVPEGEDRNALLGTIRLANEKNSGSHNPLIVHCSAGVGRSGTFVTLDHFIHEIDSGTIGVDEREDLVFEKVNMLREQRMYMVQSQVQFEFLYQVLKEKFQRRGKSASPPGTAMDELVETDEELDGGELDGGVLLHS